MTASWIPADWAAPAWVKAGTTTRLGGVSPSPYDSFNLAGHLPDHPEALRRNRRRLRRLCALPNDPLWLRQTHGNRVIEANIAENITADAAYTRRPNTVCAILTADCVPLLICDRAGTTIAAVHVGWRGLCAGIIENTLRCLEDHAGRLLAWIGPHICADHYEVGDEVRNACLQRYPAAEEALWKNARGRWQYGMETLITRILEDHEVTITTAGYCTFEAADLFFSHRRERETGRMASLIWMDQTVI